MAILVMCTNPECCELFHVSVEAAGSEVSCPQCGTVQRVTAQSNTNVSEETDVIGTTSPQGPKETPPTNDTDNIKPLPATTPPPVSPSPAAPPPAAAAPKKTKEDYSASLELDDLEDDDEPSYISSKVSEAPTGDADAQGESYELEDIDDEPVEDTPEPDFDTAPSARNHTRPSCSSAPLNAPVNFTEMEDLESEMYKTEAVDQDLLDMKPSGAIILAIGLGGMAAGLALGLFLFPWHPLLSAYLGGGIGWIAGFTIAFLLIGSLQKEPERMRCGLCGCVSPIHSTTCGLCGAPLSAEQSSPMLWTCLRAGVFAVKRWPSSLPLMFYAVLTYLILSGLSYAWALHPEELQAWKPVQYGLDVVLLALLASYAVRYFQAVIDIQYRTSEGMPTLPSYFSPTGLLQTLQILLMVAMIVLPLITLPLLPLGLLQQAATEKYIPAWRAFVRTMRRYPRDYALLWMFLLLWAAGLVFSVLFVAFISNRLILFGFPDDTAQPNLAHGFILTLRLAVSVVMAHCFMVAICRCIGRFGRFCPFS